MGGKLNLSVVTHLLNRPLMEEVDITDYFTHCFRILYVQVFFSIEISLKRLFLSTVWPSRSDILLQSITNSPLAWLAFISTKQCVYVTRDHMRRLFSNDWFTAHFRDR